MGKDSFSAVMLKLAFAAALAGCSVAGPRESPLPKTGPKMIDIYNNHLNDGSETIPLKGTSRQYYEDEGFHQMRKTSGNPLNNRFRRLPNPDLEMHVYPHLARGKYPVPGYVTVFPMFESVQYAMPGEMPSRPQGGGVQNHPVIASAPNQQAGNPDAVSDKWPQVAVDYRRDMRSVCGRNLSLEETNELMVKARNTGQPDDLARRHTALASGEDSYNIARKQLTCSHN